MSDEELPEGWAEASLGDLIDGFRSGRSLSGEGRPAGIHEIGVLKISAVTWGEFDPSENKALPAGTVPRDYERIRRGDLLISRANTAELVGAVVRVKDDHPNLMLPDKLLRIVLRTNIDPDFVKFALRTPAARAHLEGNATGTSQSMRNLSQPKMAATPLWLPPLAEQRRIVDKVEVLLTQVNAARARLAKVPTILKRFRQSILSAACSGRLAGEAGLEPDSEELPDGWRWVTPDGLAADVPNALTIGPFGSNLKVSDYQTQGVPLVFVRDIRAERFGEHGTRYVSREKAIELASHAVRPGDLLMTKMGEPPGDTAIYPQDRPQGVITADCIKLTPNPSTTTSQFLRYCFRAEPAKSRIVEQTMGVAQQKLSLARFREIRIPLPPLPEQHEIVRRVDALFKLADAIEARVAAATARADKITQAILTKAFRGEIVPTEAELARQEGRDYEPASALLARIRAARAAGAPVEHTRTGHVAAAGKSSRRKPSIRTARNR